VLAIALLDDVFNHKKGHRDDLFLVSLPYLLQFFELSIAVRTSFKLEDNSCARVIRPLA